MDAQALVAAMEEAERSRDFYSTFERLTGLTRTQWNVLFTDWAHMSYEEVSAIARKHGCKSKGYDCFAAYLAEKAIFEKQ